MIIRLPTGYFPLPDGSGPIALGKVYIGIVDTDPTIEANRLTVTVTQEDGTEVSIPSTGQPLRLSAGGEFIYQGSIVKVTVPTDFSIAVHDVNDAQQYYFPFSSDDGASGTVLLPVQADDPSTVEDTGQLYTKEVDDQLELFYIDADGTVTQLTDSSGVDAPASTLDVAGTRLAFFMSAPPVGWTKITAHDDAMMRVVSGNGGGSGGTVSPTSFDIDLNHTHNNPDYTLTVAQIPAHTHTTNVDNKDNVDPLTSAHRVGDDGNAPFGLDIESSSTGGGEPFNIGATEEAVLSTTVDLKHVDLILASKD